MKRFLLMISLVWSLFCTITTAYADEEVRYSIESYVDTSNCGKIARQHLHKRSPISFRQAIMVNM